ncbi:glycosyltransferase family 39 protein [candidate division KSB1 bacterium]|nr:glycosyltransferase family 39 protein [candidate division KSB1 bacterium]
MELIEKTGAWVRAGKRENLFFLVLLLLFALQLLRHVNGFDVPDSDFFDYRQQAIQLRNLSWPDHFKRPPLFQGLIALTSTVFPEPWRELYAAELIIALCAVFSLILVYRIARHFLGGAGGFWVAWIWACHPATLRMAIKPKPEMLTTLLILWAVDLFLRKDRRAYLIAFFATLVRYEGVLAIGAFAFADLFFSKNRLKTLAIAALAISFIVFWTVLQKEGTGGASYSNYFSDYRFNIEYLRTFWLGLLNALPVQGFKIWVALAASLMFLAIVVGLRLESRTTLMSVTFLAGFVFLHMIWPFSNIDYTIIISWIALIAIVGGFLVVANCIGTIFRYLGLKALNSLIFLKVLALAVLLLTLFLLFRHRFDYPQYNVDLWFVAVSISLMVGFLWYQNKWHVKINVVAGWILTIVLAFFLNSQTQADLFSIRYSKAEYRAAAEWFANYRQTGDRMVIDQPVIAAFYTKLDPDLDLLRLAELPSLEAADLAAWLKENNICYIAWLSTHRILNSDDNWYRWKRDNRGWSTVAFLENGEQVPGFHKVATLERGPRVAKIYHVCPDSAYNDASQEKQR